METPPSPPEVRLAGEVARPRTLTLHDLTRLLGEEVTIDFHCREGWSRLGQAYRGIPLETLLQLAGVSAAARWVSIASGGYTIALTREQAGDRRVLLALERDGVPLAAPRLVGPSEWDCFLSVKDVDRIEAAIAEPEATGPAIALARIGR